MEDPNYFQRQEELMKLKEELRILKRNRNLAPSRNQLKTVCLAYNDLQEKVKAITTNMIAFNESASAVQSALDHPVKISVGKENVQKVKHIIESIPQITYNISNISISEESELLKYDGTIFLRNMSSCEEKHRRFYDSSSLLVSNIEQLTEPCNQNENKPSPPEQPLENQQQSEGCNNFSGDSITSFSTTSVISSSPISCKKQE